MNQHPEAGGGRGKRFQNSFTILQQQQSDDSLPPQHPPPRLPLFPVVATFTFSSLHTQRVIALLASGAGARAAIRGRIKCSPRLAPL